jgi:nicotinamidase-related amidase
MAKRERKERPTTLLLEAARRNRYKVIHERNLALLWAIHASGYVAHVCKVDDPGEWNEVLCIHLPNGQQLHWKLSEADQKDFKPLKRVKNDHYDGCKAGEKVERFEALIASLYERP